ncbi:hypothetical protein APS67_004454 [Streptomyces sp. AVP053U2]|nr:hypothetical protein APS67_004454 [Streptomyces sp. AVP053U2]
MNEPSKRQNPAEQYEAIDVSDFVYAATGARVRRLTMPDGSHWFPAVDVCKELGHPNSRRWTSARNWDTPTPGRRSLITSPTSTERFSRP